MADEQNKLILTDWAPGARASRFAEDDDDATDNLPTEADVGGVLSKQMRDYWGFEEPDRIRVYNPSDLIGKKGISITTEMLRRDSQVRNAYNMRRLLLLAGGWSIFPADKKDPEAVRQQEFIQYCLDEMRGSVENFIFKISDAIRCGFKVAEIVYRYFEDGPFKGKIGLDRLIVRNSENYEFEVDEQGRLKPDGLIEDYKGNQIRLPVNKFLIWSYGRNDDDGSSLYGLPDFETAYRYYYVNDIVHRLWALRAERASKSLPVASVKDGKSINGTEKTKLMSTLQNLHRKSAIFIPPWATVIFETPQKADNDVFENLITYNNQQIDKAMGLPTLIQQEGDASGSYALSKNQFSLFYQTQRQILQQLEEDVFYEQLIRRLISLNFPKPVCPYLRMTDPDDPDSQNAKVDMLQKLHATGARYDQAMLQEYLSLPEGMIVSLIEPPAPVNPFGPRPHEDTDTEDREEQDDGRREAKPPAKRKKAEDEEGEEYAERAKRPIKRGCKHFAEISREPTERERIVNFKEIARAFDQTPVSYKPDIAQAFTAMAEEAIKLVKKSGIIENGDYELISAINVNPGKLKSVYADLIAETWIESAKEVQAEFKRYAEKKRLSYAAPIPINPAKKKRVVFPGFTIDLTGLQWIGDISEAELQRLAKKMSAQAFMAAGAEADRFKSAVRRLIDQSIQNDWDMARFEQEIYTLGADMTDSGSIMTGLRTATNRAYNEARDYLFQKSNDVVGYLFSAVLDDVTTEECRALDGRMWPKDDDEWQAYKPPIHFNCRSILTPVMSGDAPPEWDKPPTGIEPAEGFGGPVGSRVHKAQSTRHPGYEIEQ